MLLGNWIVRIRASGIYAVAVAGVVIAHMDLVHCGPRCNDIIELVCLVILALNNPVASQMQTRSNEK